MFIDKDLLGQQEDIELFNNIGCLDALEGRLTVWLTINQTPRVRWEFEAARGDYTYDSLSFDPPKKLASWNGSDPRLVVEQPTFTFRGGRRRQSIGYAEQVLYGNVSADAHYFDFYLPNADFIRKATGGDLEAITNALKDESFKVEIGNDWSIEIFTNQEALDWLKPENQNRGSMIALKIRLYQTKQASTSIQNLSVKSLIEARKLISDLCLMLSYINGGYINPVYVIAKKFVENGTDQISIEDVAALAEAPLIVAQEEVGEGCIRFFGIKDLLDFIKCFPCFQRMLQTPHWREKWFVLLEWYFQAIPRAFGRRRNVSPPVVANALGTLLENLARLVLENDESDSTKQQAKKREFDKMSEGRKAAQSQGYSGAAEYNIDTLLNRIGISSERKSVTDFVSIRNKATHASSRTTKLSDIEQGEVIYRAIQWVDEVILWRLGYTGLYRERSLYSDQGIQPRYDISQRDSIW